MKKYLALFLVAALSLGLFGCAGRSGSVNLTPSTEPQYANDLGYTPEEAFRQNQYELSLKLFQTCVVREAEDHIAHTEAEISGEIISITYMEPVNLMICPLSVELALGMTANGAKGQTLWELEALLYSGGSLESLNDAMQNYTAALPSSDNAKLNLANSIWVKDDPGFTPQQSFLDTAANCYRAEIFKTPFNAQTLKDINGWVSRITDGMIPGALDELNEEDVMYLVNAIGFDAKWLDPYQDHEVTQKTFMSYSGQTQSASFMTAKEDTYLEKGDTVGFIKEYCGGYRFAALLPKEGEDIYEFIASLSPQALSEMLNSPAPGTVIASMPKFSNEYQVDLIPVLQELGVNTVFDGNLADLTGLGSSVEGNLFVSMVLHKTRIDVDQGGTKAAASTVVAITPECAMPIEENQVHYVTLDRPFVYLILDANNLPVFMGTVMTVA